MKKPRLFIKIGFLLGQQRNCKSDKFFPIAISPGRHPQLSSSLRANRKLHLTNSLFSTQLRQRGGVEEMDRK